jgi:hypothetical protein
MTEEQLLLDLKAVQSGHIWSVSISNMNGIFGLTLTVAGVEAWLTQDSLTGFEIKESQTAGRWKFKKTAV